MAFVAKTECESGLIGLLRTRVAKAGSVYASKSRGVVRSRPLSG